MLRSLETEGGQILAAFFLLILGAVFVRLHIPKAEDVLPFALGLLSRSMMAGRREVSVKGRDVSVEQTSVAVSETK